MKILSWIILFGCLLSCTDPSTNIAELTLNWQPSSLVIDHYETPYLTSTEIEQSLADDRQDAGTHYAFIGEYRKALAKFDPMEAVQADTLDQATRQILDDYRLVDARERILELAADKTFVVFNEAHHNSVHRVFTASLLADLYEQGYRHFGLEAVSNQLAADGNNVLTSCCTFEDGYYLRDPRFARTIQTALALGYQVFGYEASGNEAEREAGQAHNISNYYRKHGGKTILHCGYSHAFEGELGSAWDKAMAGRLKDSLGVDPLTISQTWMGERGSKHFEPAFYRHLDLDAPSVLVDQKGNDYRVFGPTHGMDLYVLHPRVDHDEAGRPEFVYPPGSRKLRVRLPDAELSYPILLYQYDSSRFSNRTVPFDVQEVTTPEAMIPVLPGSTYYLYAVDSSRKTFSSAFRYE